jgi:hypothetical protein
MTHLVRSIKNAAQVTKWVGHALELVNVRTSSHEYKQRAHGTRLTTDNPDHHVRVVQLDRRASAQRLNILLKLMLSLLTKKRKGAAASVAHLLPGVIANIRRTLCLQESASNRALANTDQLVRELIGTHATHVDLHAMMHPLRRGCCVSITVTLVKHWPTTLEPWVGPLSSIVLDFKILSGSLEALCSLAWLAQCGTDDDDDDDAACSAIDPRAIHALRVADGSFWQGPGYDYPSKAELPTRGLINLRIDVALAAAHSLSTTTTATLPLLLLVVHRLPAVAAAADGEGDKEKSKVTEVLLALGEMVDHHELALHAHQWRAQESALRRRLPAESSLLAALLPPPPPPPPAGAPRRPWNVLSQLGLQ